MIFGIRQLGWRNKLGSMDINDVIIFSSCQYQSHIHVSITPISGISFKVLVLMYFKAVIMEAIKLIL